MKTDIFHLQIIPIADILVHEEFDESRAYPLVERLKKEKQLVNPILVASLTDGKFLQLDGMNRFSAFKILGLKSIVCQIIDYNDQEEVELSSWSHLFKASKDEFLAFLSQKCGFIVKQGNIDQVGHRYIKEEGMGRLITLCCSDGGVYLVSTNGNLLEKIDKLNQLVSYYKEKIVRDVLPPHPNAADIDVLFREHPQNNMMIVFPTFTRHQIVEIVKKNKLFPAGVTRHIIRRRCLNVHAPLSLFDKKKSIGEQNKELESMLLKRSFRLYEEPTIYFE
ncbi:ParB N-terminal domain-containing protein [Candidatus Gottesmanbacteria bacterium]|nr:ParB N-terminal domain-containing protein [Candidatus Gottesmanbacteria bacterium]